MEPPQPKTEIQYVPKEVLTKVKPPSTLTTIPARPVEKPNTLTRDLVDNKNMWAVEYDKMRVRLQSLVDWYNQPVADK